MVTGLITKVVLTSIVGLFAASFFKDAFATSLGGAIGNVGQGAQSLGGAFSSIGSGTKDLLEGIGIGTSKLLNPLFTLKELAGPIFGVASGGTQTEQFSTGETGQQSLESGTATVTNTQTPAPSKIFDLTGFASLFKQNETRLIGTAKNQFGGDLFGGFSSASQQNREFEKALNASILANPEFFR